MLKSLKILMDEHRVIEQVLNCLEQILERCGAEGKLNRESTQQALDFFRMFADRSHHGKEEVHLFPLLENRGLGGGCGPVAVMRREHELGRLYIQGMDAVLEAAAKGEPEAVRWFILHGQSYIRLLREHIGKEDHCLFARAESVMSAQDDDTQQAAYGQFEAADLCPGTHEKYVTIANHLADRCGVTKEETH
jgi:hemerythrin-like domain-containing protein